MSMLQSSGLYDPAAIDHVIERVQHELPNCLSLTQKATKLSVSYFDASGK